MKTPPILREPKDTTLFVKITHDRLSYRWGGVPFNTPLKVLVGDMKHILVIKPYGSKVWKIRWDDVEVLV